MFTSYFHRTLRYEDLKYDDIKDIERHIKENDIIDDNAINHYVKEYKLREKYNEIHGKHSTYSIFEEVGHIQELRFVHKWVKDNLLNKTNEEFGAIELTKEYIEQLLALCVKTLAYKQDVSKFEKMNITKAIEILKHILETTNFEKQIIFYNVLWI